MFSVFAFIFVSTHHKMECSYQTNFCEIKIFNIKKFQYITTHQIPLNEINKMYLKKYEKLDDPGYTYKLFLQTTTDNIELESASTPNLASSRKKEAQRMNLFLKKGYPSNYIYKYSETFFFLIITSLFVCIGFAILFNTFKNLLKNRKNKKENKEPFAVQKRKTF